MTLKTCGAKQMPRPHRRGSELRKRVPMPGWLGTRPMRGGGPPKRSRRTAQLMRQPRRHCVGHTRWPFTCGPRRFSLRWKHWRKAYGFHWPQLPVTHRLRHRQPDLTSREREILAHIVAGRTYGEIARELVISEKTVSVHVSHLLHKTGTASRVELAQLARRLTIPAAD
jgi:DNA-binding CsgD family transcriptional regulator